MCRADDVALMTYLIALFTAFDDSTWFEDVVENEVAVKNPSTKSVLDTVDYF